jgi:hypothetical protein
VTPEEEKGWQNIKPSAQVISEHYAKAKPAILANCQARFGTGPEIYWRSLVPHFTGWYKVTEDHHFMLRYPAEDTWETEILPQLLNGNPALYWTAQYFVPELQYAESEIGEKQVIDPETGNEKTKYYAKTALGDRPTTFYHSFFIDIDRQHDTDIHDQKVMHYLQEAVKFTAQFFINHGVTSFGTAFSGGGCYVEFAHELGVIGDPTEERLAEIKRKFDETDLVKVNAIRLEIMQLGFDIIVGDIAAAFFEKYPEAVKYVKFDALNHKSKGLVKTIFSFHKRYPYVVMPFDDPLNPEINFGKVMPPLPDEVYARGVNWLEYRGDINAMGELLASRRDAAIERLTKKPEHPTVYKFKIPEKQLKNTEFPPCVKNLLGKKDFSTSGGASRGLAFLANYLRFAGFTPKRAYKIFIKKAKDWHAETSNIFECWYYPKDDKCFIPSCKTINLPGAATGYPYLQFGGYGVCVPNEYCEACRSPITYKRGKKAIAYKETVAAKYEATIPLEYGGDVLGELRIKKFGNKIAVSVWKEGRCIVEEKSRNRGFYRAALAQKEIYGALKVQLGDDYADFVTKIGDEVERNLQEWVKLESEEPKEEEKITTFYELEDGRYLEEIVKDDVDVPEFILYNPDSDTWEIVPEYTDGGLKILPRQLVEYEAESLYIPNGLEEYGTLSDLYKECVTWALEQFDPVENLDVFKLCVRVALTSWIIRERMMNYGEKFAPIITARGPSETGKKRFLTVFRYLMYRSWYALKTQKVPSIARSIAPWHATPILDEADVYDSTEKNEFVQFMNSRADGAPIPRYNIDGHVPEYMLSFGHTVLAERAPASDDGYESRKMVYESDATVNPKDYDLIPPREWVERGKSLMRKLLLFRLRHLKGEIPTNLTIDGVSSFRVREALLLIQSLAEEDPEFITDIKEIAKKLQERIVVERASSIDGLVLNIVYSWLDDDGATVNKTRDAKGNVGFYVAKEFQETEDGRAITKTVPLTLQTVKKGLGDVMEASEIARRWRGLGQTIRPRLKIGGKYRRGVVLISNKRRFLKEIPKYVVDPDLRAVDEKLGEQQTFGEEVDD